MSTTKTIVADIVHDIAVIDGYIVGPPDASWQDVCGTLCANLGALALRLDRLPKGPSAEWWNLDLPSLDDLRAALRAVDVYGIDRFPLERPGDSDDD